MEDFFGLAMFILYLIFSVTRSRKKGMQKNRRKSPQPFQEIRDVIKPKEKPKSVKKVLYPADNRPAAEEVYGEGYSSYDKVSSFEGSSAQETPQAFLESTPTYLIGERGLQPVITLDKESIRQAVIWSEILQKPKSRRRHA